MTEVRPDAVGFYRAEWAVITFCKQKKRQHERDGRFHQYMVYSRFVFIS